MTACEICHKTSFAMFTNNGKTYCIDCNENLGVDPKDLKKCDRCGRMRKLEYWGVNGSHFMWCSSCAGAVFPD